MAKRKIIKIDEEKCNGCGECVPNCAEGALKIIGGKARLVSDVFCDGLGACLGHCPQGAITIEEREAEIFDEKEALKHKASPRISEKCAGLSELRQWPVQMMLVPPMAPYFNNADLLIAADCVAFAYPDFHSGLLRGKVLLVGCPKLDDLESYKEKLAQIVRINSIKSVTYAHMEVPCCYGLIEPIKDAIASSGRKIPLKDITIGIRGELLK